MGDQYGTFSDGLTTGYRPNTTTWSCREDPDEPLIRRFEPVLFFHPQESAFPVDAKRYVEHAALWASSSPFDDKNNWGGMPGDPFPRQPMVPAGNLAAVPAETGDYLGKPQFLLDGERDERFLELGGWKDKNGTHEPGVTATTTNVYADRDEIGHRYQNETALRASRFWYHAELYDTDRLIRLARQVSAPDLGKIVGRLRDPLLLCYYLFFPNTSNRWMDARTLRQRKPPLTPATGNAWRSCSIRRGTATPRRSNRGSSGIRGRDPFRFRSTGPRCTGRTSSMTKA